ncbi:MAG: HEAT repeat domain-containing protein [Planctomycetota bacterium]
MHRLLVLGVAIFSIHLTGCHDGPLYALKRANPYFTMREWRNDEKMGVTDHKRREELLALAESIESMPAERQAYWQPHLEQIYENDASAEMRRLAVLAAGRTNDPRVLTLLEDGMDDDSVKVRMEACRALGRQSSDDAARLLAQTLGSTSDRDVRHAAIDALANHPGTIANNALSNLLRDRNPATQSLVIASLQRTTGQDLGSDPDAWIAALASPINGEISDDATPEPLIR